MSRNIFYVAFILGILAGCISSKSLRGSSSSSIEQNSSSEKSDSLMNFLQSLLNDPEYMALSDYEQFAVLDVIYTLLESSYSQRTRTSQHHDINGLFNLKQEQN
jgi:hypothetical protein